MLSQFYTASVPRPQELGREAITQTLAHQKRYRAAASPHIRAGTGSEEYESMACVVAIPFGGSVRVPCPGGIGRLWSMQAAIAICSLSLRIGLSALTGPNKKKA